MEGPVRSLLRDETASLSPRASARPVTKAACQTLITWVSANDDEHVDGLMADYDLYLQPGEIRIPDPPVP